MLDCIDGQMQSIVLPTVLVFVKVNVKHKWNDTSAHQPGLRGTRTPTHCRKLGVVLLQPQQCPGLPVWRPILVFTYLATSLLGQGLCCFQSASQFSHPVVSNSLWPHESQHARPPCPSPTPGVYSNSYPSSQWCHPAISSSVVPFSSCPNPSQHQGLFQWVSSLHQVAKVLEFQLQHQSFQWTLRTDLLQDGLVGSPCSPRDSQESSPTP